MGRGRPATAVIKLCFLTPALPSLRQHVLSGTTVFQAPFWLLGDSSELKE